MCTTLNAGLCHPEGELLDLVGAIARDMAKYDRMCLAETKRLSNQVLNQDLDGAMRVQEWFTRSVVATVHGSTLVSAGLFDLATLRTRKK
jgi:hypothetical protein